MFSIALLVNAQQLTGSFAVAGLVSGAYAIAERGLGAPAGTAGRPLRSDRLLVGARRDGAGARRHGPAAGECAAPAAGRARRGTGVCTPPLSACVRTLLPAIVTDPGGLPALFAFESTVLEVTFVLGPPLALGLGAVWSTGAALRASGMVMLAGTLAFAAQPASRRWRPIRPRRARAAARCARRRCGRWC